MCDVGHLVYETTGGAPPLVTSCISGYESQSTLIDFSVNTIAFDIWGHKIVWGLCVHLRDTPDAMSPILVDITPSTAVGSLQHYFSP